MSLKFFFNRKGFVVLGLNVGGWLLVCYHLYHLQDEWIIRGPLTSILYIVFVFLCLLINFFRFKPWYSKKDRGYGIEEHFEKTLVPTAYILVCFNLLYFVWDKAWPILLFAVLLFIIILHVNFILIYFHYKDRDSTPPSYFVRSLH